MDRKFKGVSLSINTVIIIVVCFLVMAVVILFFTGTFNPAANATATEAELKKECLEWQREGYSYETFFNYPTLKNNFRNAIFAKMYCELGVHKSKKLEPDGNCPGTDPGTGWVCCCVVGEENHCAWTRGACS